MRAALSLGSIAVLVVTGASLTVASCSGKSSRATGRDGSVGGGQTGATGSVTADDAAGGAGGSSAGLSADADLPVDTATAARADQACREALIAQCERNKICTPRTSTDCVQFAADRCPDYYFGPHTLRTVENVEACVPQLRQATCSDIQMGISTQCLLGGLGTAGAPCSGSAECASNMCSGTFGGCGTCRAPLALGEACFGSAPCASGTLCHPSKNVCVSAPLVVSHAAEGEHCSLTIDPLVGCQGDLVCVYDPSGGDRKCTSLPKQGEPCLTDDSVPGCAPGLACGPSTASGKLTYVCGNPAPCGTAICDANSFCYENPARSFSCQPYVGASESCSQAKDGDRRCAPGFECVVEKPYDADGGRVTIGTCVPQRNQVDVDGSCNKSNAFCRSPLTCREGRCVRFDPASCYQGKDAAAGG